MVAIADLATPVLGCTRPRLFTDALSEHTLGMDAVVFSEQVCGIELMPWQTWLLDAALELKRPWTDRYSPPPFRFRTVVVLVARQNGKTQLLMLRALAGLMLWREQLAVSLAQTRTVAFEPWREGARLARSTPDLTAQLRTVRTSNGSESIELLNGARWLVAASNDGVRGFSSDVVLMDEVRQQRDDTAWSAAEKTRSAKPSSQLWAFSNAGDDDSMVLNNLVERGRELCDDPERDTTLGYFEWSADDDCDPADVQQWRQANPALGFTITPETVRAELVQDSPATFLTERLCVRVKHMGSWLPAGLWDSLLDESSRIDSTNVVFAVDASPDLSSAVIMACSPRPDGVCVLALFADVSATPGRPVTHQIVHDVERIMAAYPHASIVYDVRGPISATLSELACIPLDNTEVQRACERFYELAVSRRIAHDGNALLADHVSNAAPNTYNDAWKFARRHAAGPVNALIASVLAAHTARAPKPVTATWTVF